MADIFDFKTYLYFWSSLFGLLIFILIYLLKPKLRKEMLFTGILVAVLGVFLEYFFFQDYWNPVLIYRFGRFGGIEDLMFGFVAGGIGSVIFNIIFPSKLADNRKPMRMITALILITAIIIMLVLFKFLNINSIYSSIVALFISASIMYVIRPDLGKNIIVSALISGFALVLLEGVFLASFGKGYLEQYFLLHGKTPVIFNIFPLTEFIWGISFGAVIGPLWEFFSGKSTAKR